MATQQWPTVVLLSALCVCGCQPDNANLVHVQFPSSLVCDGIHLAATAPQGGVGEFGKIRFSWYSATAQDLSIPAATGTVDPLFVDVVGNGPAVAKLEMENLSIATVSPTLQSGLCSSIEARGAGDTELRALDSFGNTVDQVAIHIRDVDRLTFANGWGADPGPTVVVNAVQRYQVHLFSGQNELVGNSITQFAYEGPLAASQEFAAPSEHLVNIEDAVAVGMHTGSATIRAQVGSAVATLPVTLVDTDSLTASNATSARLTALSGTIDLQALVGQSAIYSAQCKWVPTQNPNVSAAEYYSELTFQDDQGTAPWFDGGDWTADLPSRRYLIASSQANLYPLTCVLSSTVSANVVLDFRP